MLTIIKVIVTIILVTLAIIGAAALEFLFTATEIDEDGMENKENEK